MLELRAQLQLDEQLGRQLLVELRELRVRYTLGALQHGSSAAGSIALTLAVGGAPNNTIRVSDPQQVSGETFGDRDYAAWERWAAEI